jgi:hypothetical protein
MKSNLQTCSVAELEKCSIQLYEQPDMSRKDRHLLEEILAVRAMKLNEQFVWTKESVADLLWVNNKLKEAFAKAKTEMENQYRQIKQRKSANDPFLTSYNLDAKITPHFDEFYLDSEIASIYHILQDLLGEENLLTFSRHKEAEMCDNDLYFKEENHVAGWIFGAMGKEHADLLDEHYWCYGMHELYSHSVFMSLPDMLKLKAFWIDVNVSLQHL